MISIKKPKIFQITKISKEGCLKSAIMQKYITDYSGEMIIDIDGIINAFISACKYKTIAAFHSNFFKFKQALTFKRVHRKTKIDSILKKCKSKFFRIIQEATKALLEQYYPVPILPQSFVTNINININKTNLNKSLKELYEMFDTGFNYDSMLRVIPFNKVEIVVKFMSMTYLQLYEGYINSKRFIEDCECIRDKEGEKFEILFRYVSKIYIKYYSISKGNKTKTVHHNSNNETKQEAMKENSEKDTISIVDKKISIANNSLTNSMSVMNK